MIALIGGDGSIGRRYQAILNYLEQPFRVIEKFDPVDLLEGCEKAIIATPTETHENWCWECHHRKIPFLCEKPLSKNKEAIKSMVQRGVQGFVVNNWAFVATNYQNKKPKFLSYDFFNTGKDGLIWDVCQLILLAEKAQCPLSVFTGSYSWDVCWGDELVPYFHIETSYKQMVLAFLRNDWGFLWALNDAYQMTELCEKIEKTMIESGGVSEAFNWNPSEKRIEALARKNFREDRSEGADSMEL